MTFNYNMYPTREEFHDWLEEHPQGGLIEEYMDIYDGILEDELYNGSKLDTAIFMSWLQAIKEDINGTISSNLRSLLYEVSEDEENNL